MNTERVLSVGAAVVVVLAIGLAASTLGSSMDTDPDDAISVDYDALPLSDDQAGELQSAAKGIGDQYRAVSQEGKGSEESASQASDGDESAAPQSADDEQSSSGGESEPDDSRGEGDGSGPSMPETNWLLRVLLLAVAVGLAYRYRERLRGLLAALGIGPDGERDTGTAEQATLSPTNEVERAWVELVRRAGIDRARTLTPSECADAAIEAGFDPDVVRRLQRVFEDVQYGGVSPTGEQERAAREALDRLLPAGEQR